MQVSDQRGAATDWCRQRPDLRLVSLSISVSASAKDKRRVPSWETRIDLRCSPKSEVHEHQVIIRIVWIAVQYICKDGMVLGNTGIYSFSSRFFRIQGSEATNWEVGTPSSMSLANAAEKLQKNRVVSFENITEGDLGLTP